MSAVILMALGLGAGTLGNGPGRRPGDSPGYRFPPALLPLAGILGGTLVCLGTRAPGRREGSVLAFAALTLAGGRMLLESVRPPEETGARGALSGTADAFLAGLSVPVLTAYPWCAALLAGSCSVLAQALCPRLPKRLRLRLAPWFSAAGGLTLACLGMQTLLHRLL